MGFFDFLKPITEGLDGASHDVRGFLSGLNTPSVSMQPGPQLQAAAMPNGPLSGDFGPQAPAPQPQQGTPLTNDYGPGVQTSGVQAAPNPLAQAMQAGGPLMAAPQGTVKPGLLDRITATSPDGVTFSNKLAALGSILQGDSQGAQGVLQQAREGFRQKTLDDQKSAILSKRSAAFKKAMATGKFDPAVYAQMSEEGFDPDEMARLETAFGKRKGEFMNGGGNGGIYYMDPEDPTHPQTVVKGQDKPPGQFISDGAGGWTINPAFVQLQEQVAAAKRRGAPPVGHAAGRPRSYGSNDVDWH